jgi:hypothetical protein
MDETTANILTECNFIEAVWHLVAAKFNLPIYSNLSISGAPAGWVKILARAGTRKDRKKKLSILITFWWLIWMERNKRIFEDKEMSAQELARLIQETVNVHHLAWIVPTI